MRELKRQLQGGEREKRGRAVCSTEPGPCECIWPFYSCGTALEPSVVAIFDTGFDRFHEDLPAKVVWRNALGREGLIVYKYNLKY